MDRGFLMKIIKNLITLIVTLGWCLFFNYHFVQAEGMPVTVQLQLPANNKSTGVVNLDVQPQQTVNFAVLLRNSSSNSVKIQIAPGVAKTNENGAIFLGDSSRKGMDSSWHYHLRDLGFHSQTVTVAPQSTKKIPVQLTIPKYQGSISGSIIVRPIVSRQAQETNQIQQAYGVLLNVGHYDQLSPKISLGPLQVRSQGGHSVTIGPIHNQRPIYYGNGALDYRGQIINSKHQPITKVHLSQAALAANSILPLTLDWGEQPIKAGNYLFKAQVREGQHYWQFKRHFTITNQQAVKLNQKNLNLKPDHRPLIITLIAIALVAIALFFWLVFWYAKNKGAVKASKNR
ncbi:hypothetical protein DS831_05005 [Bombilactobacillus bombi]|uniref:Uncharacterized protein n=2 Tax=Bombilactobacillus bombi TaxID=1303590 RepID=A0A3R6ZDS0_9LACO|nr:hypothetical protein DS831_05005 [Bombilactobacillus bombi]